MIEIKVTQYANGFRAKLSNRRIAVFKPEDKESADKKQVRIEMLRMVESEEEREAYRKQRPFKLICREKIIQSNILLTNEAAHTLHYLLGMYLNNMQEQDRPSQRDIEGLMAEHES